MHLKSHEDFIAPLQKGPAPAKPGDEAPPVKTMKDVLDGLYEDVKKLRDEVLKLPAEELARLQEEHAEMLKSAEQTFDKLAKQHARSPKTLGDEWERYRKALQLTDDAK